MSVATGVFFLIIFVGKRVTDVTGCLQDFILDVRHGLCRKAKLSTEEPMAGVRVRVGFGLGLGFLNEFIL